MKIDTSVLSQTSGLARITAASACLVDGEAMRTKLRTNLRILAAALSLLTASYAGAITVHKVTSPGLADVKVYVTDSEGLADCVIYVETSKGLASGNAKWYYEESQGLADVKVYFTDSEGLADKKVFFTTSKGLARCDVDWKSYKK